MKLSFFAAVNTNLQSKSLPNGQYVRGVVINNPTGGWLYYVDEQQWIPPYTNGWSMPSTWDHPSVTVNWSATGPAGQVTTQVATGTWELQLDSEPTDLASGGPISSFIQSFTPQTTVVGLLHVPGNVGATSGTIVAAVANQRLRILEVTLSLDLTGSIGASNGGQAEDYAGSIRFGLRYTVPANQWFRCKLGPTSPHVQVPYGEGLDLIVGSGIDWLAAPSFTSADIDYGITYQVV